MSKHDFLTEFIELYEKYPCLWKKKDPQYHNSHKREACYNVLLKKYKEHDKNATVKTVKKKINSLRSAYNKEVKKVKESVKSGAGSSEVYEPSLWYYNLFGFLNDQQDVRQGINTMDDDDEDPEDTEDSQSVVENDVLESEDNSTQELSDQESIRQSIATAPSRESRSDIEFSQNSTSPSPSTGSQGDQTFPRPSNMITPSTGKKRPLGNCKNVSNKKVLQLVADRLTKNDATKEEMHSSFGKHVAEELTNMAPEMVPFVKKIINDAIFEGHMKSLNRSSAIITQPMQQVLWSAQPQRGQCSTTHSTQGQLSTAGSMQSQSHFSEINYTPTERPSQDYTTASYFSQFPNTFKNT